MSNAILSFKSHTSGKNADVNIYEDRIEWVQTRGINWGLAIITCGLSVYLERKLPEWMLPKVNGSEMMPVKRINSVVTRRKDFLFTTVSVVGSGNTVDFNVTHEEAANIKSILNNLVLAS